MPKSKPSIYDIERRRQADRITKDAEKKQLEAYRASAKEIKEKLNELNKKGQLNEDDLFKYGRLQALKERIAEEIKKLRGEIQKEIRQELKKIYKTEYELKATEFLKLTGKDNLKTRLSFAALPKETVKNAIVNQFDFVGWENRLKTNLVRTINRMQQDVASGIVSGEGYRKIAERIENTINVSFYEAERIARTETGRVQEQANVDCMDRAEKLGIKFQRIWVSASDSRVRESHEAMNGQVADEEGFFRFVEGDNAGAKTRGPHMSGIAEEDINCRCDVITELIEETQEAEESKEVSRVKVDVLNGQIPFEQISVYKEILENAPVDALKLWNKHADEIKIETNKSKKGAFYSPRQKAISYNLEDDKNSRAGANNVFFHEVGHLFDDKAGEISFSYKNGKFDEIMKAEYIDFYKSKMQEWKKQFPEGTKLRQADVNANITKELKTIPFSARVEISDIFDGLSNGAVNGGAGHTFENRNYWKTHKVSSEAFANMYSAKVNNPDSVETLKKYMPKSYEFFEEILKEAGKDEKK
jgi:SPP1 gp7 family putative phage head morphogenesis protein